MISITSAVLISTTVAYVSAFFVGRYLLHSDAKQRMRRKYPMFEAFDKGKNFSFHYFKYRKHTIGDLFVLQSIFIYLAISQFFSQLYPKMHFASYHCST